MDIHIHDHRISFDLRIHHAGCSIFCFVQDPLYTIPDAPYSAAIRVAAERKEAGNMYCRPMFQAHFLATAYVQLAVDPLYFAGNSEADTVNTVREYLLVLERHGALGLHNLVEELEWQNYRDASLYSRQRGGKGFTILGLTAIPPASTCVSWACRTTR